MFVLSKIVVYDSIDEFEGHVPKMRRFGWDYNYFSEMPNGMIKAEWIDKSVWSVN